MTLLPGSCRRYEQRVESFQAERSGSNAVLTEDLPAIAPPVAAEHHTRGVETVLVKSVADQGDALVLNFLTFSSVPDRSVGVSEDGRAQVSAAVELTSG